MSSPQASIIIPAKDQEAYIFDALVSLTRQDVPAEELEVIVIDDASQDRTGEIAQEFADAFGTFTLITHPENQGVAGARNTGIHAANADTLFFLDPDDWYGPQYLGRCLAAMNSLDLDMVRTDHTKQFGSRRQFFRTPELRRHRVLDPLDEVAAPQRSTMLDFPLVPSGAFSRRFLVNNELLFNEDLATAEDREFMWRCHLTAQKYAVISEPGFFYRRGLPTSLTASFTQQQLGFFKAFDLIFTNVLHADLTGRSADKISLLAKAHRQFLAISCFHADRSIAQIATKEPGSAPEFLESLSLLFHDFAHRNSSVMLAAELLDRRRRELVKRLATGAIFETRKKVDA